MSNNERYLTVSERMMSASAGSLLTSLTLTPMDVVRIRLQQQGMMPECTCEPLSATSVGAIAGKDKTSLHAVKASKLLRPAQRLMEDKMFWEGPCFTELKCKRGSIRFNNTWDAFYKIAQMEGPTTLWRGISLTLLMAIPANIVYFTGYEYIRDFSPLQETHPGVNPLFCGAVARVFAATTVAPIELMKTKFQSIPRSNASVTSMKIFQDLLQDTRLEVKMRGINRALFKGLEITLWRDVPFSAIYWGSYEFCKKHFWLSNEEKNNTLHFVNSFGSGSVSGMIAAFLTHPFDVGKTRLQISLLSSKGSSEGNNLNVINNKRNMFKYLNIIRKNEGIKALYTGLGARIVKIAPSCAIMISSYEISKKFFNL